MHANVVSVSDLQVNKVNAVDELRVPMLSLIHVQCNRLCQNCFTDSDAPPNRDQPDLAQLFENLEGDTREEVSNPNRFHSRPHGPQISHQDTTLANLSQKPTWKCCSQG